MDDGYSDEFQEMLAPYPLLVQMGRLSPGRERGLLRWDRECVWAEWGSFAVFTGRKVGAEGG